MRSAKWVVAVGALCARTALADDGPPPLSATSIVLDPEQLLVLPIPGHTFDAALGIAPGTSGDGYGTAFSGSTSLDNRYFVDGMDVTGVAYHTVGAPVPLEFVSALDVANGGFGADLGRSIGGAAAVTTRSGTDEFHGSVFAMISPGALAAHAIQPPPSTAFSPIVSSPGATTESHVGFELGGPIVPGRAWFYVGFAPTLDSTPITRTTQRETDCRTVLANEQLSLCSPQYANGVPDVDPMTGVPITNVLDRTTLTDTVRTYSTIAKVDVAPSPTERGSLMLLATPQTSTTPTVGGVASSGLRTNDLTTASTARWTSKLRDDSLELDAQISWYRDSSSDSALDASVANQPHVTNDSGTSLANFASFGGESAATIAGCTDGGSGDPYPAITNCPTTSGYVTGGPGELLRALYQRASARIAVTDRFTAAGRHALTVGVDGDLESEATAIAYSGGETIQNDGSGDLFVDTPVVVAPPGSTDPAFDRTCAMQNGSVTDAVRCMAVVGYGPTTTNRARDAAGFVRDRWQLRPDLALDLGVRYDMQRLEYGSDLQGVTNPATSAPYGTTAAAPHGHVEPRLEARYDPSHEGRALVFASWGRYTEALDLDLAVREFSVGQQVQETFVGTLEPLQSGPYAAVASGLRSEYLDEAVLGARAQLVGGFVGGVTLRDRRLHDVVEDMWDGTRAVLGNPGATPSAVAYDSPTHVYDALELTLAHRFADRLYVQASYTYSRTWGDYPGSISYNNAQTDPNISTQYDEYISNANHRGLLPQDRPHYFKVDASYVWPLDARDALVLGARFRAFSGTPEDALAANSIDGPNEEFLLPRGTFGRTPFSTALDAHVGFRRALRRHVALDVFADVFNLYNSQPTSTTDQAYTTQNANPISGGTYADLIWLRALDPLGNETPTAVARNPDFQHATNHYAPLALQLGARLTF